MIISGCRNYNGNIKKETESFLIAIQIAVRTKTPGKQQIYFDVCLVDFTTYHLQQI